MDNSRINFREFSFKIIMFFFFVGLFFTVSYITYYISTDLKYVGSISVRGHEMVSEEEIIELTYIKKDQLFMSIQEEKLVHSISSNPIVKSVSVNKQFPNKLNIEIEEYRPMGCYISEGNYYLLYENDYRQLIDDVTKCVGPVIEALPIENENIMTSYLDVFRNVDVMVLNKMSQIIYQPTDANPYRFIIYMSDGNDVIISLFSVNEKLNHYQDFLEIAKQNYGNSVTGTFNLLVGQSFEPHQ